MDLREPEIDMVGLAAIAGSAGGTRVASRMNWPKRSGALAGRRRRPAVVRRADRALGCRARQPLTYNGCVGVQRAWFPRSEQGHAIAPLQTMDCQVREQPWPELPVLVAIAAIAALSWGFIKLADEVVEGETHHFDQWVIDALRNPDDPPLPLGPGWLVDAARDITALGSPTVLDAGRRDCGRLSGDAPALADVGDSAGRGDQRSRPDDAAQDGFDRPRPPDGFGRAGDAFAEFSQRALAVRGTCVLTLGAMLARVMPTRKLHLYFIGDGARFWRS